MAIEITTASLIKILTPVLTSLAKGALSLAKDQQLKWNAANSAEKLTKIIIDINTVKTMWSRDRGILIDEFYYPSKIHDKNNVHAIKNIDDFPFRHTIIEGIVGQGKSIFLRHLCNSAIEKNFIPVFIELRMISEARSLYDLILSYLETAEIEGGQTTFSYLANTGNLVLILDGFDEIQPSKISDTIYTLENIKNKYEKLKIIISSRPYNAVQNLGGFNVYSLSELNKYDYEPFLRKLITESTKRFAITQAITDAPDNIKGVITTPLMLTLLVLVYESESEIPSTLPDFFDKLFNTVFTKHDKLKAGFNRQHHSKLSESKLLKLFDAFCFMIAQDDIGRSVKHNDFRKSFERAIKYTPDSTCELEHFKQDVVNVACLMLEDGFDQVSFLHKSILEYHAASFIKNSSDEIAKKFYQQAPDNFQTWETVLLFLSNIDSYRYGRDYILQEYPTELIDISNTLKSGETKALVNYVDKKLPEAYAGVNGSTLRYWNNSRHARRHSFISEIDHVLFLNTINKLKTATPKALQSAIRATAQGKENLPDGHLKISAKALLENLDYSSIWRELTRIEQKIIHTIEKYQGIVSSELKKKSIFD